jgi:hypothetical protein
MNRAFNNSMSLPKAVLSDMTLLAKSPSERAIEGREKVIFKQEFKKLKEDNLQSNLMREQKKLDFKKNTVIEKEMRYMDKIRAQKNEKLMLEKCKIEVHHQQLKNKEQKHQAIIELKDRSVIDKNEKLRTKQVALRLVGKMDLEEVFKDEPKKIKEGEEL